MSLWLFIPLCLFAGVAGFLVLGVAADLLLPEATIGPVGLVGFAASIASLIWYRTHDPNVALADRSDRYEGIADGRIQHTTDYTPFWIIAVVVLGFGGLFVVYSASQSSSLEVQVSYGLQTTLAITNTGERP